MNLRARSHFFLWVLSSSFLVLSGCHGGPNSSTTQSQQPNSTTSISTQQSTPNQSQSSLATRQAQAATVSLNQTQQYALTGDDVALLQSQGVLSDGDQAAITPFVKQ